MSNVSRLVDVCGVNQIGVGEVIRVEVQGLALAVFHLEDGFYVTDDACTHGPGQLSEGIVACDVVECNFHQGAFNIKTGEVVQPPCMVPVKTYRTVVDGDRVCIEV